MYLHFFHIVTMWSMPITTKKQECIKSYNIDQTAQLVHPCRNYKTITAQYTLKLWWFYSIIVCCRSKLCRPQVRTLTGACRGLAWRLGTSLDYLRPWCHFCTALTTSRLSRKQKTVRINKANATLLGTSSKETSWQPSFSILMRLSDTSIDSPLSPVNFSELANPPAGLLQW